MILKKQTWQSQRVIKYAEYLDWLSPEDEKQGDTKHLEWINLTYPDVPDLEQAKTKPLPN